LPDFAPIFDDFEVILIKSGQKSLKCGYSFLILAAHSITKPKLAEHGYQTNPGIG
jgi:hypothetical protein